MAKKLALFMLGVLVGYGAHYYQSRSQIPAVSAEAANTEVKAEGVEPSPELATLEPDAIEEQAPEPKPSPEASLQAVEDHEYTTNLNLEEQLVRDMEDSREELRRNAYTIPTGDGWRLRINTPDKLFLKAGLNDGDLITSESIESQLNSPEKYRLALRVVEILKFLER